MAGWGERRRNNLPYHLGLPWSECLLQNQSTFSPPGDVLRGHRTSERRHPKDTPSTTGNTPGWTGWTGWGRRLQGVGILFILLSVVRVSREGCTPYPSGEPASPGRSP